MTEGEKTEPVVRNRVKCLVCGTVLESLSRHDFQSCGCENQTFVDGGHDYSRVGGVDLSMVTREVEDD